MLDRYLRGWFKLEIRILERFLFFRKPASQGTIAKALFVTHFFVSLIATTKAQIKSAASYIGSRRAIFCTLEKDL